MGTIAYSDALSQSYSDALHTGLLFEVRDRFGNTLTIARRNLGTGSTVFRDGAITRITTPNGRTLDFTYDNAFRIAEVTDNLERTR